MLFHGVNLANPPEGFTMSSQFKFLCLMVLSVIPLFVFAGEVFGLIEVTEGVTLENALTPYLCKISPDGLIAAVGTALRAE